MKIFRKMFEPINYLRIRNSHLLWYSYLIPISLSVIFSFLFLFLPKDLNVFGDKGLVDSINGLLSILAGFYIASLAAVATFQNSNLDKFIQGEQAMLRGKRSGKEFMEELTRRRFLCLLFGYCSLLSIFLFIIGIFSRLFKENLKFFIAIQLYKPLIAFFILIYMFLFFNLVVTTLIGLNYLTDRIHRP
jgi:hypothetical protein